MLGSGQEVNRNSLIALLAAIVKKTAPGSTVVTDSVTSDELAVFHGAGWYTNVDTASDIENVLWATFVKDSRYTSENIGLFEGAYLYERGVFRPTDDSVMNTNQGQFNAPSRMAIYNRINKLANGDGWVLNYDYFVNYDAINRASNPNSIRLNAAKERSFAPLHAPIVHKGSWRDVKPNPKRVTEDPSIKSSRLREVSTKTQRERTMSISVLSPNYATYGGTYMNGSTSHK